MRRLILALLLCAAPLTANAASYSFTWNGGNGYRVEGVFKISDSLAGAEYVNELDVECFRINGFLEDKPVGTWGLGELTDDTSWRFNYEPKTLRIRTGGSNYYGFFSQEWNMNGQGNDCGKDGFGFNSGNAAQDICLDNKLIRASQIRFNTPLKAKWDDKIKFGKNDCEILLLM